MTTTPKLDGAWYFKGVAPYPDRVHFVPAGLPVALCGQQTGSRPERDGTTDGRCSECFHARRRIEAEMASEVEPSGGSVRKGRES